MPLGGIDTGTVGLGGRGDLRDRELIGHPAQGFSPDRSFFAIRTSDPDGGSWAAVLEGALGTDGRDGDSGSTSAHAGLPRCPVAEFAAAYPARPGPVDGPRGSGRGRSIRWCPVMPRPAGCPSRASATGPATSPIGAAGHRGGSIENIVGRDGIAVPAHRTYATADEPGLVLASHPHGDRPARPFPYLSEVWTGMEHAVATALVRAGMRDEAQQVVSDVRTRYDGRSRNPLGEIECGHHYVRSPCTSVPRPPPVSDC